jgi:hypothetical protein
MSHLPQLGAYQRHAESPPLLDDSIVELCCAVRCAVEPERLASILGAKPLPARSEEKCTHIARYQTAGVFS